MSVSAVLGTSVPTLAIRGRRYPVVLPNVRDPRLHLAAAIVSLQVIGQAALGFRLSIAQILVAMATCAVLETGIAFWQKRILMWPASALLTGNGVAFILRVPGTRHGDWWSLHGAWIFAGTAALALLSKYVIRLRGRHVFNPSNFGLVLCFLALGDRRAQPLDFWWGPMSPGLAVAIGIIIVAGLMILSRLQLLLVAAGFWIAFAAGVGVLALSGHSMTARWHLGPISNWSFWWVLVSSPEILVFLFFMITDPKTVPERPRQRSVYAVSVGLLAALLIAPERTEFATKVAVLGALALVCAVRPLIGRLLPALGRMPRMASMRPSRAAIGVLAVAGAAVYASALLAAGLPARSSDRLPAGAAMASSVQPGDMPEVTVLPSKDVASRIDRPTALLMARDVVADLSIQADALRRRDLPRAATVAGGAWLDDLQRRIRQGASGRPVVVPTYRVQRVSIGLAAGPDQGGPQILISLQGTVERATYTGSSPRLESRSGAARFQQTFQIAPTSSRYLIVASRGESSLLLRGSASPARNGGSSIAAELLPVGGGSAAQGMPFAVRIVLRDTAAASLPVDLGLTLAGLDGTPIPFYQGKLIVPGKGQAVKRVSVTPSQWFPSLGTFQVAATVDGRPSGAPLVFTVTKPALSVPRFQDVTKAAGLETSVPAPGCGQFSNSAAWADVNGDGYPDLFLTRLGEPAQLFVSDGRGHFRDEAAARGVAVKDAVGAAFADYDNDGHPDLYVAREGGDVLLHNDGNGHFADVTSAAGISDSAPGASVAWGDFNGDGKLDVYVTSYVTCVGKWTTPYALTSKVRYYPDKLYENNGDGTFSDVTALLGKRATNGAGFAATWFDYNGDNRPDIYLGNDFIGASPDHNHLWRNDGQAGGAWKFSDVSSQSQTGLYINTMGIAVADLNRDLKLDLALSNIGGNELLRNDGNGTFTDVAPAVGVARPLQRTGSTSVTWGVGAYDFNLDGWDDLYFAAGNVSQSLNKRNGPQPNELYVNDGTDKRFLDLSAPSGADDRGNSKGVAFADYDGDGRMDMYVVDQGGAPRLYRNVTPIGQDHWLEVDTQGTVSNRDGCGARLALTLEDGSRMVGQVFCSGNQKAVHFGLGKTSRLAKLDVIWPSGIHQELRDLKVDRLVTVREPAR